VTVPKAFSHSPWPNYPEREIAGLAAAVRERLRGHLRSASHPPACREAIRALCGRAGPFDRTGQAVRPAYSGAAGPSRRLPTWLATDACAYTLAPR